MRRAIDDPLEGVVVDWERPARRDGVQFFVVNLCAQHGRTAFRWVLLAWGQALLLSPEDGTRSALLVLRPRTCRYPPARRASPPGARYLPRYTRPARSRVARYACQVA